MCRSQGPTGSPPRPCAAKRPPLQTPSCNGAPTEMPLPRHMESGIRNMLAMQCSKPLQQISTNGEQCTRWRVQAYQAPTRVRSARCSCGSREVRPLRPRALPRLTFEAHMDTKAEFGRKTPMNLPAEEGGHWQARCRYPSEARCVGVQTPARGRAFAAGSPGVHWQAPQQGRSPVRSRAMLPCHTARQTSQLHRMPANAAQRSNRVMGRGDGREGGTAGQRSQACIHARYSCQRQANRRPAGLGSQLWLLADPIHPGSPLQSVTPNEWLTFLSASLRAAGHRAARR